MEARRNSKVTPGNIDTSLEIIFFCHLFLVFRNLALDKAVYYAHILGSNLQIAFQIPVLLPFFKNTARCQCYLQVG